MTLTKADTVLRLTSHPLQRCGARAAAELARADDPGAVTPAMLDEVADLLAADLVRAASVVDKEHPAYDWWKVLFALYPNSPVTHSKRSRDPGDLRLVVGRLFAGDPDRAAGSPCAFCGQPASTLWGKDKLPMFDSLKAVNTLPPGLAGWPVCRGCRIAMWALPYGSWVTAGSATVMTCPANAVERQFVQRNLERARRIQHAGFSSLPANASAETVTLAALRELGGRSTGSTLWLFKNDNQDAWLRVTATRGGIPSFLRRLFAEPECQAGWGALQRALTRRDKDGAVTASGAAAAARTLFDPVDRPGQPSGDRLERELLRQAGNLERFTGQTLAAWRALCRLYLEVVHGMDTGQVKPARELITAWIMVDPNPRGRYNKYAKAASRWTDLQRLLMDAAHRLLLDGGNPPDITPVAQSLLAPDLNGWRLRGLLYFDVVAELVNLGAPIGHKTSPDDPEDEESDPSSNPPDDEFEEVSA